MTELKDTRIITSEVDIQTSIEQSIGQKSNVIMDSQLLTAMMSCWRLADFRFNHNFIAMSGKSNSLECGSIVHKYLEVYRKSQVLGLSKAQAHGFGLTAAELYIAGCPHCTDFVPTHSNNTNTQMGVELLFYDGEHHCDENCILSTKCGHDVNEYPGVSNTPKENEGYLLGWRYVLDTCEQYFNYYKNIDYWVPLEVEIVKGKVIYEDDDMKVLWKAKLDLIADTNQGIFPIDTKTMKQNRDTLSLNNQFMGQCLLTNTQSVIIDKVGFQKTLKPEEKFKRVPVNYHVDNLLEWQSEIVPHYARLLLMYAESGYWPPNFNSCETKYGKCSFVNVCSASPLDRERVIRNEFKVGRAWDIQNVIKEDE